MKSKNMSKILMDNILYICLLLMIVIIAIISPSFISARVLSDVLTQSAPKMLLASDVCYNVCFYGSGLWKKRRNNS